MKEPKENIQFCTRVRNWEEQTEMRYMAKEIAARLKLTTGQVVHKALKLLKKSL